MSVLADVHVGLGIDALSRADIVSVARRAEDLGYRGLFLTESYGRDVFGVLTQVALATQRLHLGTGIVNVFGRSAATIAQGAATLSEVMGGRTLTLGIGTSGRALINNFHGVDFTRPVAHLGATLRVLRRALDTGIVVHEGRDGFPLGVSAAGPVRIFVAALTPVSRRVAREADGWLPLWLPDAAIEPAEPGYTVAAYYYTAVDDDAAAALDVVRRSLAWYVAANGTAYATALAREGYAAEVEEIVARWRDGDRAGARAAVPDVLVTSTAMAGTPQQVAARLVRVRRAGVSEPILRFPDEFDAARVERALTALADAASQHAKPIAR